MSVKMNVPKLRFGEFGGEWDNIKLADVGKVSMCKRIMKDQTTSEGEIPFYKIGTFGKQTDAYISKELYESYKTKYSFPKKGDILISASGTIGRTVVYDDLPAYFQDSNIVWIDNHEELVKNTFLSFCYETIKWNTENTTIARLYNDNLRNIQINIPSLPEQEKIASFLSSVDTKIEQLTKKKTLLEQYKKGVMQKIFSQEIRFRDDDGGEYPEWIERKLGEVATRKTLKNKENIFNFVLTNSATQGIVSQQDYFDKDIANQNNLEGYYIVDVDDFVYNPRISVSAPVGPIKRNKLTKGVMSPLYTVFRFEDDTLDYYENYFQTIQWHGYMKSIANYGARHDRMAIANADFMNMPIPSPCIEERKKIANFLTSLDTKISQTGQQLEAAKQFKKALLQKMFV